MDPLFYTCQQNYSGWTTDKAGRTLKEQIPFCLEGIFMNVICHEFMIGSIHFKQKCGNINLKICCKN
jgi:hypothetical protein